MDFKKQNDRLAATSQTHRSRFPAAGAAETPRDGHSLQRNLGQPFLSGNPLMKSANRATRRDALGLRRRGWRGGLRTNWRHPCFQCNCTYLASHLRGSFRGSGLIESIGGAMRERERERDGKCKKEREWVAKWSGYLAHYSRRWKKKEKEKDEKGKTSSSSGASAHSGHFQSVGFNRCSVVARRRWSQLSFYRNS